MPTQNHPIEPSAFRELQRRVERLENENHRLSGRKLLTVDRFTTADLPGPTEGQVAIEATTDDLKYYANSAWRTVGGSSLVAFPTEYHIMYPFMLNSSSGGITGYTYTDNFGVNRWNQYYIQATTLNAKFYRIVRLGPAGSIWGFTMVARTGSDGGQMTVSVAQLSEDNLYRPTIKTGALEDIDDAPATFYDLKRDVSPSTTTADFYAAGTTEYSEYVSPEWRFQLGGSEGSTLSAVTFNTGDDLNQLNSGSGMYAFRFKTTGQNASSSGYRVRLHYLHLHRLTGSQLTT